MIKEEGKSKQNQAEAFFLNQNPDIIEIRTEEAVSHPTSDNSTQKKPNILKGLAHLKHYRLFEDRPVSAYFNDYITEIIPSPPKISFFSAQFFVIQNVRSFQIYKWEIDMYENLNCHQVGENYIFADEINNLDIILASDQQLKVAVGTRSINNIFSIRILENNRQIERFNNLEEIYGIKFLELRTSVVLVVNFQKEIIVFAENSEKKYMQQQIFKKSKLKSTNQNSGEVNPFYQQIKSVKIVSYQNIIYSAYLIQRKQTTQIRNINLLLDQIIIQQGQPYIRYQSYTMEKYTKPERECEAIIKEMTIRQEQPGKIQILLEMMSQVILIELTKDKPRIQCPYQCIDEDYFALNPILLENSSQQIQGSSKKIQDFLLIAQYYPQQIPTNEQEGKVGKIILLNICTYEGKIKQQFGISHIKDIIMVPNLERQKSARQLIRCCIYKGKIVFFFFSSSGYQTLQVSVFHTIKVNSEQKIDKLLPTSIKIDSREDQIIQFKSPDLFIPQADMQMLLILNSTYNQDHSGNKLFKYIWQKAKKLLKQEIDNRWPTDLKLDALESYSTFLFKVNEFDYINSETKSIIKQYGIKKSFLRKFYNAVKIIFKEQIGVGNIQTNLQKYLKCTFFLKKLFLFPSKDALITQGQYNDWQGKDIKKQLLNHIKSKRNVAKVREIINIFKSYFILNYQKIIHEIFVQENAKGSTGTKDSIVQCKQMLQILLPHYIQIKSTVQQKMQTVTGRLAFQVNGQEEEVCFDDLKLNTTKTSTMIQEANHYRQEFSQKYMIENDFSFKQRRQLILKQDGLVNNNEAIIIFLNEINQNTKFYIPQDGIITSPQERFLKLLVSNNFINKQMYRDFSFMIKFYKLHQKQIKQNTIMKKFLATTVQQIFCNIIFQCKDHDQTMRRIELLLTKVMTAWDPTFRAMSVDLVKSTAEDQHSKYRVFETYLQLCFKTANNKGNSDFSILEKCKIFLEVIGSLQKKGTDSYQFVIEKIMITIFKFLRTSYKKIALEIKNVIQQVRINNDTPADQFKSMLETFSNNFDFFETFNIDTVLSNLQSQQVINSQKQDTTQYQIKDEILVQILQNYVEKKLQNTAKKDKEGFDLLDGQNDKNRIVIFKRYEEGKNGRQLVQLSFSLNKPKKILQLLMTFAQQFFKNANTNWEQKIFNIFLDVLLNFQIKNPQELGLLDNIVDAVHTSEVNLSHQKREKIFYEKLKKQIETINTNFSKEKIRKLIEKCLQILQTCMKMKIYVREEQLILKLTNSMYDITDIPALINEKDNIIHEMQYKHRQGQTSHSFLSRFQDQENQKIKKLNTLFQLSTKKKCDEYIDQNIKNKSDLLKIVSILKKSGDLFEPLYLVLKIVETNKTLKSSGINCIDQPLNKKSQQNLIRLKCNIIRNLIFQNPDLEEFFQKNWEDIVSTKTEKVQKIDNSHIHCDVQMFSHVPQFLQDKYYAFVQLLYNDYARGARMLVRYRKKLNYDIQKAINLVKIFLKWNKQKGVRNLIISMQMLANIIQGSLQIFRQYNVQNIKKYILKNKSLKDQTKSKAYEGLEFIYDLYSFKNMNASFETVKKSSNDHADLSQKKNASDIGQSKRQQHRSIDEQIVEENKLSKKPKQKSQYQVKQEENQAKILFQNKQYYNFIKLIQKSKEYDAQYTYELNEKEKRMIQLDPNDANATFINMHLFRLFSKCIKFDENIGDIFPFQFFMQKDFELSGHIYLATQKQRKLRDIFDKYLRKRIRQHICEANYRKIAQAVKFGFGNFTELEFKITLIYMQKMISQKRAQLNLIEKQNDIELLRKKEANLRRNIELIVDTIDQSELTMENEQEFTSIGVDIEHYKSILAKLK